MRAQMLSTSRMRPPKGAGHLLCGDAESRTEHRTSSIVYHIDIIIYCSRFAGTYCYCHLLLLRFGLRRSQYHIAYLFQYTLLLKANKNYVKKPTYFQIFFIFASCYPPADCFYRGLFLRLLFFIFWYGCGSLRSRPPSRLHRGTLPRHSTYGLECQATLLRSSFDTSNDVAQTDQNTQ